MMQQHHTDTMSHLPAIGAERLADAVWRFTLWAPRVEEPTLELVDANGFCSRQITMTPLGMGYWQASAEGLATGELYRYRLNPDTVRPDPASRHQPLGVHGPSALVDPDGFAWTDERWRPPNMEALSLYELHLGTFTEEGTFDAAIRRLDDLVQLGVSAVELMPLAQCPGQRNWGYDGVYPFAVQHSFGGLAGLQRFVDAAHARGLAVWLDVVYNHLGPEGNYLRDFGPYFTDRYRTPWGEAVNFDGPHSDHVRHFFLENARYWLSHCHIDGLRLDATHAIFDLRPDPFLRELSRLARDVGAITGKERRLIAESHSNDPVLIRPESRGGLGLDGVWADDLHHAAHCLLTGEAHGYYMDYDQPRHLVEALRHGFGYRGEYSRFFQRRRGDVCDDAPGSAFTVFIQNHDQVGNRMQGERLTRLTDFAGLKLAAGLLLFSPFVPLLFMGEEYGEENPFLYFIDHGDESLVKAVQRGRKREFKAFSWKGEPPDPQSPTTFERSKLDWRRRETEQGKALLAWYTQCLRLRRELPALAALRKDRASVRHFDDTLFMLRRNDRQETLCICNLGQSDTEATLPEEWSSTVSWSLTIDSSESRFGGNGSGLPKQCTNVVHLSPRQIGLYVPHIPFSCT